MTGTEQPKRTYIKWPLRAAAETSPRYPLFETIRLRYQVSGATVALHRNTVYSLGSRLIVFQDPSNKQDIQERKHNRYIFYHIELKTDRLDLACPLGSIIR